MTETDFPKKIAENVTMYSADPIVYVVNDFLNDHECNSFIEAEKAGEYKAHFDSFDYKTEEGKKNWEPGGQRLLTAIAYLNDVEDGGGTDFPELGFNIDARKGDVLIFHNCEKDTTNIHPKSLHAGMPVTNGEKWIVNLWFRERLIY